VVVDAHRVLQVVASSSEDAELMELLQLQNDQGPCLDCFHTAAPVSVPDLSEAGARWPLFVEAVAARGAFRSVHALPLRLRGEAVGALNLSMPILARCPWTISRWGRHWRMSRPSASCPSRRSACAARWRPG